MEKSSLGLLVISKSFKQAKKMLQQSLFASVTSFKLVDGQSYSAVFGLAQYVYKGNEKLSQTLTKLKTTIKQEKAGLRKVLENPDKREQLFNAMNSRQQAEFSQFLVHLLHISSTKDNNRPEISAIIAVEKSKIRCDIRIY